MEKVLASDIADCNCVVDNKKEDCAGIESVSDASEWFVMRDRKRPNALLPAYKQLAQMGIEIFTPMRERLIKRGTKTIHENFPCLPDLLFVHDTRDHLDPIVDSIPTLQYRYVRGGYKLPMTVPPTEMERFIRAVSAVESPKYYLPEEITESMRGQQVRISGGPLDGLTGRLLKIRGSGIKRLLVEIPNLIAAGVEVREYDYLIPIE